MDISKIFTFITLTQKFRAVVRDVKIKGEERFENDMEHSYQFAMFVWYLNSSYNLQYNTDKLIRYALMHDLVETYAGDTPALTSSEEYKSSKFSREQEAFQKIMEECPEFDELESTWTEYMNKTDKESRLVYVVDKIMPVLNEIQQDSGFYKRNKITLNKWKAWLKSKTDRVLFEELEDAGLLEALLQYLENDKERLFFGGRQLP